MNISNKLTLFRLFSVFVFMGFLFLPGLIAKIIAFLIFCFACITDFVDGWLARKRNEITDLGKILDPIADKVLVLSAFLAFVELNLIWAWMVVVIIIRELFITGIRLFALRKGKVLEADIAGKHKTVSQMTTIICILIVLITKEMGIIYHFWTPRIEEWVNQGMLIMMFITVSLTLISGFSYLWVNRKVIRSL